MGRVATYEQRLKELQKETQRLRKDIRSVAKAIRKDGDSVQLPPSRSYQPLPAAPTKAPSQAARTERPAAPEPVPEPAIVEASHRQTAEEVHAAAQPPPGRSDKRLTSYLSSGSFGKSMPLTRERRVVRARAIFMLLVVALFAALLYHFIF